MNTLEERVATIERQLSAIRAEIKHAAHELRDDQEFVAPFWRQGADHMSEHIVTKASRKVFLWILSAAIAAALVWLGSLGVLFK